MPTLQKSTKGILTFISAIIINLLIGNSYTFANINLFIATYLKYTNYPDISKTDCYFFLPICVLMTTGTCGFGGLIERRYGSRLTISLGILIIAFAYLMLYFALNLILIYFLVALIGLGIGLAYMPPLRTLWKYYPDKKGLCTGIILAAFGFSAMFFNKISDEIINPDRRPIDRETQFYSEEVGKNVPKYYMITFLTILVCGLLGVLLLFNYEEEVSSIKSYLIENVKNSHIFEEELGLDVPSDKGIIKKKNDNESIRLALKSRRFWLLVGMAFLYVFYPYMLTNLIKSYGLLSIDEESVNFILLIFPIANGATRILWGYCLDLFGFKVVYLTLLFIGFISSTTISLISSNAVLYTIYCFLTVATLAGNYAALPFIVSKVFGIKNSVEIYGFIFVNCGLSCFIGPFVIKFVIGNSNEKSLFHSVFWIGSAMQFICIILCFIFTEQKFDYEEKPKITETKKESMIN